MSPIRPLSHLSSAPTLADRLPSHPLGKSPGQHRFLGDPNHAFAALAPGSEGPRSEINFGLEPACGQKLIQQRNAPGRIRRRPAVAGRAGQTGEVRFDVEHRFGGSPDEVAALLTDPRFYCDLALPDLSQPTVLDSNLDSNRSVLRLRYEFVGSLDPMARRLLGRNRLFWVQDLVVHRPTLSGELAFAAEADPRRLHGTAHFTLEAEDGSCVRRLVGELVVAIPVIGSQAERRIMPGVLRRLDIEAEAVNQLFRGPQT